MPKTHAQYWKKKIAQNRVRDAANIAALSSQDWRVAVVWECELKEMRRVKKRLSRFLG